MSGGEQQMLVIGRGLMSAPKLMLIDEVSQGLAPLVVQEIYEIIKQINKSGVTILFVEQNADLALEVASAGFVLEGGHIVEQGTTKDLRNNRSIKEAYLGLK